MKLFFMPQLSPEWWEVRRGVPTASAFDRIITPAKGELSKSASGYIAELCGDVLCQTPNYFTQQGRPINSFAIQNGIDTEPEARRWLSMNARLDVAEVGFCYNADLGIGCSPDGLIGHEFNPESGGDFNGHPWFEAKCQGVVELKCPLLATQVEYILAGTLPTDYKPQCHGHLIVTGAAYCEFVSYARGAAPLRVRVERDGYTDKVEAAVKTFVEQYRAALDRVRRK